MNDGNGQLRSIFERWKKLEEEKASISDDLKELFAEAKSNGYDGKALRAAFRHVRKMDDAEERSKLEQHEAQFDLYVAEIISGTGLAVIENARTRASREGA